MATFNLDGVKYELPSFDLLTLGEWRTLKRESGMNMQQIEELGDAAGTDPDVLAAVIHVAVARARPELSFDEIKRRINMLTMDEISEGVEAEEAEQSPPAESSPSESEPSSPSDGDDGGEAGEPSPETETPPDTGQPDSDTGQGSDPETSTESPAASLKAVANS